MDLRTLQFFLERTGYGRYVDLFIRRGDGENGYERMLPAVFEKMDESADTWPEPTLRIKPAQAQQLMDELWSIGFRPTQGQQSEGQFAAQGRHLNDMRAIVAHAIKTELPKA